MCKPQTMTSSMNKIIFCIGLFLGGIVSASHGFAQTKDNSHPGFDGTAGIGPIVFANYTGGKGLQALPIPQINATYNDMFYVYLLRAGVYFWGNETKTLGFGLAVEPRFGFGAHSGSLLTGMTTRRSSLEGGLSFDWASPWVDVNLAYFGDMSHASNGTSTRVALYKEWIKRQDWNVGLLFELDHISKDIANYYFGVRANEVTASRPLFQPGGTTNVIVGFDGNYAIDKGHKVVFGLNMTQLGSGVVSSPIVQTHQSTFFWMGYAWNL